MKSIVIAFLTLFLLSWGAPVPDHHPNVTFLECLTVEFKTSNSSSINNHPLIFTPQNASAYESLLTPQNKRPAKTSPYKPLLILTPFHESEIQAAVRCSKKLGIQIRVKSGGHDYEGLSYTSNNPFVIIDMRNLRSVSINTKGYEKTARVQAGATLGQIYYAASQESWTLAFMAGVCPTVGVGGHFSGGGYGMMARKHGIAADHIIDAKVIDADGRILDRKSMGEDHFWAIRGGGGTSFGIVLAFKVKLVRVPEIVTVFTVPRALEQNATQLVHRWQYVAHKLDENLSIRVFLRSVKSQTNGSKRTIVAYFTSLFLGRGNDLISIMQEKFPELGLVKTDCTEMSWIESVLYFSGLQNQPQEILLSRVSRMAQSRKYFNGKSDYVKQPIPLHCLRGIWKFLHEEGDNWAELQLSPYGGVFDKILESETPFPHRKGNMFMIHYDIFWTGESDEERERHMKWIRGLYSYMAPYVSKEPRAAYLNYRDLDIGMNDRNVRSTSYEKASVWGKKYFGNNFERLVRVKTEVDPTNFCRNEQSIPPLLSA